MSGIKDSSEIITEITPIPKLNLEGWVETRCFKIDSRPNVLNFELEPEAKYREPCPGCGCYNFHVHGYRSRSLRDINIGIDSVDLALKVPQYLCQEDACKYNFPHPIPFVEGKRKYTNRLHQLIEQESFMYSFTDVAYKHGLSVNTIKTIFMKKGEKLNNDMHIVAPKVLGIDENHLGKIMRGVFTDIENSRLLELTESRKKEYITKAIKSMENYEDIKIVTMDMFNPYRQVVHDILPNSDIIVDKFHVFKMIYNATEDARKIIRSEISDRIDEISDTKERNRQRDLLTTLGKSSYLFKFNTDNIMKEPKRYNLLIEVCKTWPEFNTLNTVKIAAENIYTAKTALEAKENFEKFKSIIPSGPEYKSFRSFANTTFKNWEKEILNYFNYGGFTNAATEGLNNMIEHIDNMGYGYSFNVLRYRSLFHPRAYNKPIKARTPLSFGYGMNSFMTVNKPKYISGSYTDIKAYLDYYNLH